MSTPNPVTGDGAYETAFQIAQHRYAELGVDATAAMNRLTSVAISLHCWQGDDVRGFEDLSAELGGGLAVTGNYPGRARTPDELRADIEVAFSLIPGKHRLNLHASYGEFPGRVDRDRMEVAHFQGWIDWAKEHTSGMDFNPTYFSHRHAGDGLTLAHPAKGIREFWIEHGACCRRIAAEIGRQLQSPCINNVWIPDGYKDSPADRALPRQRLAESLDQLFAEDFDPAHLRDAVECKLFGLGSESYVVGSHEFYLGYAISRNRMLCLDAGHFHPTEVISDKISSVLTFLDEILLHVSRGVRWDSDHVVTFTDELNAIAHEIVRGDYLERVHVGLDFFDASINRVAAWVIGTRNTLKALLCAMLEPTEMLREAEQRQDYTKRLAWMETLKSYPLGAVWDYYCLQQNVPTDAQWLAEIQRYENEVLRQRN